MKRHAILAAQLIALSVALLLVGACADREPRFDGPKGQLLWDYKMEGASAHYAICRCWHDLFRLR